MFQGRSTTIKNLLLITLTVILSGCFTVSPERQEKAKEYEELSKAESNRAASLGEQPGTPENIDGMKKAEARSVSYRESSNKESETLFDVFLSILLDNK